MALTSFKLRKTDDDGSHVRKEDSLDSSLRSDDVIEFSGGAGLVSFETAPFKLEQLVVDGLLKHESTVRINWAIERGLETNPEDTAPVELHITVNQYGEPLTVENGTTLVVYTEDTYVEVYDHISILYKPGTWLYYGLFLKYSDGANEWFERIALSTIQIPKYYESLENLWNKIPEYYRALDYQVGGSLRSFLSLFGWELDRIRSLIDSLSVINDPLRTPTPALDAVAKQLGVPTSSVEVGTSRLRSVLNNIFNLRQQKGTFSGTASFISALTGCNVSYDPDTITFKVNTQRVNLVSDPKFRQQDLNFFTGTPSDVNRTPFTLRKTDGGSALRDTSRNDDAIRNYNANPTAASVLAEYTTNVFVDSAASVGWGVYTYGAAFNAASAIPIIEEVNYAGQAISANSVEVVNSGGTGIKITIPSNATGSQTVVVYGRKPFYYRNDVTYYTSFDCNLSGAYFINYRLIDNDFVSAYLETNPPDSLGEDLYYDTWNTEYAANQNIFMYAADSFYNASAPGLATAGRFALEQPKGINYVEFEKAVVPALVFLAEPGETIVVSRWLVEPNFVGRYFDGDDVYGGFVKQANQVNAVGVYDYRWGTDGGNNNQDFSYYTLDYDRIVTATERIVEEHLMPVNMIGQYTIEWNTIPGE
jgi:phage tail-like protein